MGSIGWLLTRSIKRSWEMESVSCFCALVGTTGSFDIYQQHSQSEYTEMELTNNDTSRALVFLLESKCGDDHGGLDERSTGIQGPAS